MTMLQGTKKWMKQSITVYPASGFNSNGQSTYTTPITIPCLIIQAVTNTRDAMGNDATSTSRILIEGSYTVTNKDKIVLPDGTIPYIISVENVPSMTDGTSFAKVIYT